MSKRLIRMPEVISKTGLQKSAIYKLIRFGQFPGPVRVSAKVSAWLESEVDLFIDQRLIERDEREARLAFQENGRVQR
jgi:prophage regulatory protein